MPNFETVDWVNWLIYMAAIASVLAVFWAVIYEKAYAYFISVPIVILTTILLAYQDSLFGTTLGLITLIVNLYLIIDLRIKNLEKK
jgi:hypothetical protein